MRSTTYDTVLCRRIVSLLILCFTPLPHSLYQSKFTPFLENCYSASDTACHDDVLRRDMCHCDNFWAITSFSISVELHPYLYLILWVYQQKLTPFPETCCMLQYAEEKASITSILCKPSPHFLCQFKFVSIFALFSGSVQFYSHSVRGTAVEGTMLLFYLSQYNLSILFMYSLLHFLYISTICGYLHLILSISVQFVHIFTSFSVSLQFVHISTSFSLYWYNLSISLPHSVYEYKLLMFLPHSLYFNTSCPYLLPYSVYISTILPRSVALQLPVSDASCHGNILVRAVCHCDNIRDNFPREWCHRCVALALNRNI